jgi:hypothetical protein
VIDEKSQGPKPRRDPLGDLEARIDAAIEEVRPKLRKAFDELEARVDSAVKDLKPRVDEAMDDVRPRVDSFLADAQPRLDGLLQTIQSKIAELRKDLEDRAARSEGKRDVTALPRTPETGGDVEGDRPDTGPGGV